MEKSKIVLIGPVYPYKGGISHYTGLMYRALKKKYDVSMISYRFQYPKLLYKKEQRDYSNDSFKVEDTNYWIHTANPFNWIGTAKKIKALKPELVIIQWWHPYFAPCYFSLCKILKGIKILFVCHNVFPHERFPADRLLTKMVLKQGDCYIVQSKMDAENLHQIIKNPIFEQTVHPTYNIFKTENLSKEEARKRLLLEDDENILLFFGFIREYKGLKYLIKSMSHIIKELDKVKLLIVGDFIDEEQKKIYLNWIKKCNIQEYVQIYDGYIPDREVEKFFAACDLVVLPYVSATQSGIVQIAFGFEKPVVVTKVGGLPEVVKDGETGYVIEPGKIEELVCVVLDYFTGEEEQKFHSNIVNEAYRFSWDKLVEKIELINKNS